MKKNIIKSTFAIAMLVGGFAFGLGLNSANATKNPNCPNGCLADGKGCYCYQWYWGYLENGSVS